MKVLFAFDGSECAEAAIDELHRAGLPENARLVILSIEEDWVSPPSKPEGIENIDRRKELLARARRAAARMRWFHQGWDIVVEVAKGSPAAVIIERAGELKCDLIVLGSHGREAPVGAIFGSVAQKVLLEAPCSVRITRGRYVIPDCPVRLIIGMDGLKSADRSVKVVSSRKWPEGTEIRLVNAMVKTMPAAAGFVHSLVANSIVRKNVKVLKAREEVDSVLKMLRSTGLKTSFMAKDEEMKQLLCGEAESWRADCIFVEAREMDRFDHSSISDEVAANAFCSVEVVRTPA
ncbi:MAG: universal stress protein [Acidobacteria bacterium]|nr:universal stress protein [Acidobacteriota bacterium]